MAVKFVALVSLALSVAACAQTPSESPSNQTSTTTASPGPSASVDQQSPKPDSGTATAAEKAPEPEKAADATAAKPVATAEPAATADPSRAAESSTPAPKPQPQFREVVIPAGTTLSVRLTTPLASDKNAVEDPVRGTLTTRIAVDGLTAVPAQTEVVGTVREVRRSGRVKGRASIGFRFERLVVDDEPHAIRTAQITRQAAPDRSDDVKKGVIGGAAGAIVGGIVGGGRGAAIGAGAGATGAVLVTRGDEVKLPAGTTVRTTLQEPLKVVVPLTKPAQR